MEQFLTAAFYLIVVMTTPEAGKPPKLNFEIYSVEKCPDLKVTKEQMEGLVKSGNVINYDVVCIPGPVYVPPSEGEPS